MATTSTDDTSDRPAADGIDPGRYPGSPVERNHTAPVARRVRATIDGHTVVDSVRAMYVWEHPYYPQFYLPAADVDAAVLRAEGTTLATPQGQAELRSLVVGDRRVDDAARYLPTSPVEGLADHLRFEWSAMDAWFEEDEEIFLHPRSPYVRVDALRSSRHIRVEKDGVLLAESTAPVAVFETGLPTRWYLDRGDINWSHFEASDTRSQCPYKGITTGYWSIRTDEGRYDDLAWSYDFPTRQLSPVAGLVCLYNEKVDLYVDGALAD